MAYYLFVSNYLLIQVCVYMNLQYTHTYICTIHISIHIQNSENPSNHHQKYDLDDGKNLYHLIVMININVSPWFILHICIVKIKNMVVGATCFGLCQTRQPNRRGNMYIFESELIKVKLLFLGCLLRDR